MTRRYTLILLSTLTLAAVFNFSLAWRPSGHAARADGLLPSVTQAATPPISGPVGSLAGRESRRRVDKLASHSRNDKKQRSSLTPAIIGSAEAAAFPLTPTEKTSPEELEVLSNLRTVKEKLDARAKALDARQHAMEKAETGMKKKLAKLEAMLAQNKDILQQQKKIKNKKVKLLATVYASMKPAKAAQVISKMDLSTVIKMFAQMDEKKVGKILSFLSPDKAVQISQKLIRLNAGS